MSKYVKIDKKELEVLRINAQATINDANQYEKQYLQARGSIRVLLQKFQYFRYEYSKAKCKKEKQAVVQKLFDFMEHNNF
jgi:hypothetical protein